MATYIIIGGDGKEYGPITSEDVRQWLTEGRLSAQSLAKAESDAEFRPLEKFPEFADAFTGASNIPPKQFSGTGNRNEALQKIKVPALGLIISAVINLILSAWSVITLIFFPPNLHQFDSQLQQMNNPQLTDFFEKMMHVAYGPFGIVNALFNMAMAALILMGALKMQSLKSYEFAFTAAVLSVIPCLTPCCGFMIGLAFGVWALVLLKKPAIKSQFD